MKKQFRRHLPLLAALALAAAPAAHAQLTAGNVRAAQRTGTKLVDIDYDITGTTNPVTVLLEISADGGTTWSVPATTLTGAVGPDVTPAANLRITWNAGAEWNDQASAQTRFRLRLSGPITDLENFALIPGGSFTMGDAIDGLTDAPTHTVNLSTFYMQKVGVTKAEWDAVRAWGLAHGYNDLATGAGKGADHPVQMVAWYDVVKWCNARSEQDGLVPCYYTDSAHTSVYRSGTFDIDNTMVKWTANGYRLPTEAEREKAARGGLVGQRFPWGNTISHTQANFWNVGGETYQTGTVGYHPVYEVGSIPYTSPVGSFAANGYGIYDMAGNVWEWLWDFYDAAYYGVSPVADPQGPASGSNRVWRGGSWDNYADGSRVAYRTFDSPGRSANYYGFRPVRANLVIVDSPNSPVNTIGPILTLIAPYGTTDPVAGQYQHALGTQVHLTAGSPDPGYLFSKWTIGTGGSSTTSTANPLSVTMDSDKTITAVFVQDSRDPDGDGLTNYQEIVVYHTSPNIADTDLDGFNDGYEVNSGFSPTDPASTPETQLVIYTAVEVRFGAALGQNYRVESSTDLQTWTTVEEHIVGTGGIIARLYSIQEIPKRYFRSVRE